MEEPLTPPTLYIDEHGERVRGQIRLAIDRLKIRRLQFGGLVGFSLLFYAAFLEDPLWMPVVYVVGFLFLLFAGLNLSGAIQIPQTIELDGRRFGIGEHEIPLASIDRIDATSGPLAIVAVLRDGTRQVWAISEDHHNLDDISWLVEQVRVRLG